MGLTITGSTRVNPHTRLAIALAAIADAAATAILLRVVPMAPQLPAPTAAALHGAAILMLFTLRRVRASRHALCIAAVAAVPVAGVAIAAITLAGRGRGSASRWRRRRVRRRREPLAAVLERLGNALSPCDALGPNDGEPRRAALLDLSKRSDPEAIALLRWAVAGRDPDLALSAALVLDEIRERAERLTSGRIRVEARRAAR